VILNDKSLIPLLFESIEKGFGLPDKCAAVAALEKFNGNPKLWLETPKLPPPSYYLQAVGMNRVFPAEVARAERNRWERVFHDDITR
jgi:hypothetical protein